MHDWTPFVDAKTTDIYRDLLVSNFIRGASFISCMRRVTVTKFILRNPVTLGFYESSAAPTFRVTHLGDTILASCSN